MNVMPVFHPEPEMPGKIQQVVLPKLESATENGLSPALHFSNCSITINFK